MFRYKPIVLAQWGTVITLFAVAASSVWSAWNELPASVISHFNARGLPDRFMPREDFFIWLAAFCGGAVLLLMALPQLLRVLPDSAINLPRRDYWLAPERRAEARERVSAFIGWIAVATAALLTLAVVLTVRANIHGTGLDLFTMNSALGAYIISTLVLLVAQYRRFARPPSS